MHIRNVFSICHRITQAKHPNSRTKTTTASACLASILRLEEGWSGDAPLHASKMHLVVLSEAKCAFEF